MCSEHVTFQWTRDREHHLSGFLDNAIREGATRAILIPNRDPYQLGEFNNVLTFERLARHFSWFGPVECIEATWTKDKKR